MTQTAYNGCKHDMLAGKVTLMAAADSTDITELSARARADRVTAGQLEADGVPLRDGNLAGTGDWIVTRRNDRRLSLFAGRDWVKNGDTAHPFITEGMTREALYVLATRARERTTLYVATHDIPGFNPADALTRTATPGTAHRPQHQRSTRLAHQPARRRPPCCHARRYRSRSRRG